MFHQVFSVITIFINSFAEFKSDGLKYLFYTGLIAFLLLTAVILVTWQVSSGVGVWLASQMPWEWARESIFFSFMTGVGLLLLFWICLKYLMLLLLSPLLSVVSLKVEKRISFLSKKEHELMTGNTVARSLRINLRNLLKELMLTVVLLILGFIPGLNLLAFFLLFIIQAYFIGFGFMDYYLERYFPFNETVKEVYRHKWAAVTLGSIFTALLFIPVIGVVIAPYFTTVSATRYFISLKDK